MKNLQVRWGLVGTGDIARKRVANALRALSPSGSLQAVASSRPSSARAFAEEFRIPKVHFDWESLMADPGIDAVYIATPVHLHEIMTRRAAREGKHVLCEKPMALTYKECRSMIRACRSRRVKLGIAYYRRFYPAVQEMKRLIDSGTIGEAVFARFFVAEKFNPERKSAPRSWLVQRRFSGGGPMMDMGCHRIDLLVYLMGDIRSAHAEISNIRFHNRDVEDHAVADLVFRGNGRSKTTATATVAASHCFDYHVDEFEIFGTRGSLHCPLLADGRLHVKTGGELQIVHLPPHQNLHFPLVKDFNQAILTGKDPFVPGEEGAKTSRVLDSIYGRS